MNTDVITSAKNPIVKHVKKLLASGKYRREENLAVAEGIHLAQSVLASERDPQIVICAESALSNVEVQLLHRKLTGLGVTIVIVKDSLFESISDIHAAVGIVVVFSSQAAEQVPEITEHSLLLENIQDPGNLGTILRTSAAAGIANVFLSPGSASAWSPKALRAGMGAQFSLGVSEDVDLTKLITETKLPVLATDVSAEISIYDTDLTPNSIWLFGNEGQGVSPQLLKQCTQRVTIPQAQSTVESLNVSAAVAVCLFEQRRKQTLL